MFPRHCFQLACDVQQVGDRRCSQIADAQDINALYFNVARDVDLLRRSLTCVIEADPFIARHFEMYEKIMTNGGPAQSVTLQIQRSDYMLHAYGDGNVTVKQVSVRIRRRAHTHRSK